MTAIALMILSTTALNPNDSSEEHAKSKASVVDIHTGTQHRDGIL